MPDHSSFLTMILAHMRDTLQQNAHLLGTSIVGGKEPTWHSWEPFYASVFIVGLVVVFALSVRGKLAGEAALIP